MNSRRLLLAEDDPQDEMLTLRALAKVTDAHQIEVVRDGAEVLDFLFCRGEYADRDPGEIPAVLLLDLKLPKLSGLEVLARLRADPRTRSLPVVILTSSDSERDIAGSYEFGVNSYVRKPLDAAEFSDTLARLGHYWLALNEPPKDVRWKEP